MEVQTVADSSTAQEQETAYVSVENLNSEQRSQWLSTGTLPKQPTKADPAPAKESSEGEPEGDTPESAPAPEAGTKQEHKPRRSNAEARIKELLAENKRLKAEAESHKAIETTKPAESSPAKPAEQASQATIQEPTEPKEENYDGSPGKAWEDYQRDVRKYHRDLAKYEAHIAVESYKQQQAQERAVNSLKNALDEAGKRYSDYDSVAIPVLQQIGANYGEIHPMIRQMLDSSPVIAHALYVLGGDAEGVEAFINDAKTNPVAAARKFAVIEQLVKDELGKAKGESPTDGASRNDKGQFTAKVPDKQFSSAPPPVKEVGAKATAPTDEAQAALDRGDGAAYRRIMNARELAARKG